MASKISADIVITQGNKIAKVWQDNPEFTMKDVTQEQFKSGLVGLESKDREIEAKRFELTGLINEREDQARILNEWITRARGGFRSFFGPNSNQYEQAGGTRSSERKRPTRRSQASTSSTP
jgi:hypothetical protein